MNIKEIVKDSRAVFDHYANGKLFYNIVDNNSFKSTFQIPIDTIDQKTGRLDTKELGETAFVFEYKAITLMRYIRKAIEDETIIDLRPPT